MIKPIQANIISPRRPISAHQYDDL